MATYKLLLEDEEKDDFSLIAIHCSEEAYKMAYLINKHLGLRLRREHVDLDFSNNGLEVTFPLFKFENVQQYTTYHLVANKCKSFEAHTLSLGGGLFGNASDKTVMTYLLSEYKKVDFFLKIFSEFEILPLRRILANINEIKQVISAYEIVSEDIKSKNNLIFN